MLDIIDRGIDRSDKIINDLLDYAREIHLNLRMHSPRELLADALTLTKVPEEIRIVNNVSPELEIRIDPDKMGRVFINLIKNAVDAMPNGGTLTVSSKHTEAIVEISFADTGVGIAEENLSKMFSPLFSARAYFAHRT